MKEHHVEEILAMVTKGSKLSGYGLYDHAFKYDDAPPSVRDRIAGELNESLMTAKVLRDNGWLGL